MKGIFFQQLRRWKMENKNSDGKQIQSLQQAVSHCSKEFNPRIATILQLLLTLPVGSCSCERSFSSLRRLETWSRTGMANARLNGLALAYIHKPTEIDSSSVLKRWNASGHRRIALAFSKTFTFLTVKEEALNRESEWLFSPTSIRDDNIMTWLSQSWT